MEDGLDGRPSSPGFRVDSFDCSLLLFSPKFHLTSVKGRFPDRASHPDPQLRRFPIAATLFAQKSRSILLDTHTREGHHHVEVSPFWGETPAP